MKTTILDLFEIDTTVVNSSKIRLEESRIDPQFFSTNQSFIDNLNTKPLIEFCVDIFNPPVFKREFLEDPNECRYLASAEIVSFESEITYITNSQADALRLKVKKGWILITGFGTIGSIRITDTIIDGFAVANNVTRAIVPDKYSGFIAAFLASDYGNKLLNDYAAGAVVKYIEAPQIARIPIPILAESIIESINQGYLTAVACREQSHGLIRKAHNLVFQYNNLQPLTRLEPDTLDAEGEVEVQMTDLDDFDNGWRLDAHFYNKKAKLVINSIKNNATNFAKLEEVVDEIVLGKRFKRNYVKSNHGTPFIGSKNILQIRPSELKYLSNSEITFLDDLMLKSGMILIACSGSLGGTFGKTCFVHRNFEDYAASQHILRVIPNQQRIDAGYLYAYLSSDYGYCSITRYRWGALIDEIDDEDMAKLIIPLCEKAKQREIGDLVRKAYELRAEAIRLEDEAQELLTQALTQA